MGDSGKHPVSGIWGSAEPLAWSVMGTVTAVSQLTSYGQRERQGGNQCSGRELLRRGRGREWGTQVLLSHLGGPVLRHPTPAPFPASFPALKLLAHFLEAIRTQLMGRHESGKTLPKGMEEAIGVLGSVSAVFLPPHAQAVLTASPPPPKLPKLGPDLPPGFREMADKLPNRPAKKLLLETLKKGTLMTLGDLTAFLSAYSTSLEATDRAVKGLLELLAKKKVLDPDDVHEYHIFITVQLKDRDLNQPLAFVPALMDSVELEAGEVRLRRRKPSQPLLPPSANWLCLKLLGALFDQLADLQRDDSPDKAQLSKTDELFLWTLRDLSRCFLPASREPTVADAFSLSTCAKFLVLENDAAVRDWGRRIQTRLMDEVAWDAEETSRLLFLLAKPLSFSPAATGAILNRLVDKGWLEAAQADVGHLVGEQNPLSLLAQLSGKVELCGETELVVGRVERTTEALVGEPPRRPLSEECWPSALELLVDYVRAWVPASKAPDKAEKRRVVEKAKTELGASAAVGKETALMYVQESLDERRSLGKVRLGFVVAVLAASTAALSKPQLMPFLFFLKSRQLISIAQLEALRDKSPFPLHVSVLKLILDKVLAWKSTPTVRA